MKEELIKSYINKLKKEDIKNYLMKEYTVASDEEIDLLYNLIKKNADNIKNVDLDFISKYERYFNKDLYFKIIEKYNKYKSLLEWSKLFVSYYFYFIFIRGFFVFFASV